MARLEGVVEDVLVHVGSLILPVDFVVLNFDPDSELPFFLGYWACDDKFSSRSNDHTSNDKVEMFDIYNELKLPAMYEELSGIIVNVVVAKDHYIASKVHVEHVFVGHDIYGMLQQKKWCSSFM